MIIPPHNVETAERIVRICGGSAIFYLLFFTGPELLPMQTAISSLALYPVLTGLIGRCWIYGICDVSTVDLAETEPVSRPRSSSSADRPSRSPSPRTSP